MFIASPQKWMLVYLMALISITVMFSKMHYPQTIPHSPLPKSLPTLSWKW